MVVFGDPPNDDLVLEQRNLKSSKSVLYKEGITQDIEASALEDLMDKVRLLSYSDAVAQFNLNLNLFQQIKDSIKKWSCTHIRIFTHQGKVRILFFDAKSFAKIPIDNYLVRIGNNSICTLIPSNKDIQYLIRDQEIYEPFITFMSPRLGVDIVFSPSPNF